MSNTVTLESGAKVIQLQITKPKGPIPIELMAALQGPPGPPGTASSAVTV